jgi:hypothetical protein
MIVKKGDWIRIVEIPQWVNRQPNETQIIFKKALNKTFKIESFDEKGFLELDVWIKLRLKSIDTIWIDPKCVIRSRIGKR